MRSVLGTWIFGLGFDVFCKFNGDLVESFWEVVSFFEGMGILLLDVRLFYCLREF